MIKGGDLDQLTEEFFRHTQTTLSYFIFQSFLFQKQVLLKNGDKMS